MRSPLELLYKPHQAIAFEQDFDKLLDMGTFSYIFFLTFLVSGCQGL